MASLAHGYNTVVHDLPRFLVHYMHALTVGTRAFLSLWLGPGYKATCRWVANVFTVPLTSNLSVHACPLASDSKAARMRRPRYSRVNIRVYASAIRVTRVCARVTSTRSTRQRVSIASIPRPLPPRKKVEGLGMRLAYPLRVNFVHAFEREHVRFRVLACTRASTRVCVCEYSRVLARVHACACASTRMRLAHDMRGL